MPCMWQNIRSDPAAWTSAVRMTTAALSAALTPAQAAPLLVFCLLYTPCIAAVAAVKRELGGKWATIMVVNQCVVAWVCALLVRLVAVMVF